MADEDIELHADMVYWQYDENGDLTPRSDPLPLATKAQVLEDVPYLDGKGTYKEVPAIKSDQYPSADVHFTSRIGTGVKNG